MNSGIFLKTVDIFVFRSTELELCEKFYELLKIVIRFGCSANETLGHDVISMSRTYVQRCKDFLSTLNGTTADRSTTELFGADNFGRQVHETIMLHAKYVMELAEQLNELTIEGESVQAVYKFIKEIFAEKSS
jgi:hypothetical protein